MGREVRRVAANWEHPKDSIRGGYKGRFEGDRYLNELEDWEDSYKENGLQETLDDYGPPPEKEDYMPSWTEEEKTHYQMYENTSEGTPISPVMDSIESLAHWLADNKASAFAGETATYDEWLSMCTQGYAPSAVYTPNTGLISGVKAAGMEKSKC